MTISDETRAFVDGIEDLVVKAELTHLISTVEAIAAGAGGDERATEFSMAFDRSVSGYQEAMTNQRVSINRLLEERRVSLGMIRNLQTQLNHANAANRPKMVGPK